MLFTIRSGTAHRFAKDPLETFVDATTGLRSTPTPSMLLGTFMHTLLFGSKNISFIMSDKVTAKIKLVGEIDGKEIYGVKEVEYLLYNKYMNSFIKAVNRIPLLKEIFDNGTVENTFYASAKDYFKTMGLELNLKDVLIQGTPDLFYVKDDVLYLVDFKSTSSAIDKKSWLYSIHKYGYLNQFIHYKTLIEINSGREFKDVIFMHWVQNTSSLNKGFFILDNDNIIVPGKEKFIADNTFMCSMLNTYGENFLDEYPFELETLGQKIEEEEYDQANNNEEEFYNLMGAM